MSTIRFTAEIGEDQTIHLPVGVQLTPGKADVIVVQPSETTLRSRENDAFLQEVPEIAKNLARFARAQNAQALPPDFAMNHDHYLHGAPKGIDQP
jgi:hypothetical protein